MVLISTILFDRCVGIYISRVFLFCFLMLNNSNSLKIIVKKKIHSVKGTPDATINK